MKLIHISDIHINPEPILDCDPIVNFQKCLDHVETHHRDSDMVVISGDLTHHGQRNSYIKLRAMLDNWSMSPLLILGNHDHRETFSDIFPEVKKDQNGHVQYVKDTALGHFIFLDTIEFGTHKGHYCKKRQTWLREQLDNAVKLNKPAYLFMHHNPVVVGVKSADALGIVQGDEFRAILNAYSSIIKHIFFGHCHFILSGSVCGIPFSAPRSTNHPCVPIFNGKSVMGIAPFPPTYNICLLNEDNTVVHSIDFCQDEQIKWIDTTSDGWIDEEALKSA